MSEQMKVEPSFPVPDDKTADPETPKYHIQVFYEGGSDTFYSNLSVHITQLEFIYADTHLSKNGLVQRPLATRAYNRKKVIKRVTRETLEGAVLKWD